MRAFSTIYDWGDTRINANPEVLLRWRARMLDPRFLHGEPGLYRSLGWGTPAA